jgi:hypothetical protein
MYGGDIDDVPLAFLSFQQEHKKAPATNAAGAYSRSRFSST